MKPIRCTLYGISIEPEFMRSDGYLIYWKTGDLALSEYGYPVYCPNEELAKKLIEDQDADIKDLLTYKEFTYAR